MNKKIDIWSKGEVVSYLQTLVDAGQIKPCSQISLEYGHAQAYYPRCGKDWASRINANNVTTDITAYSAPSCYYWLKCPENCPHFKHSENFQLSASKDQYDEGIATINTDSEESKSMTDEKNNNNSTTNDRWWAQLSAPQATILAAVIAILPSVSTGVLAYINKPTEISIATKTIQSQLATTPGYKQYIYPRLGLGFQAPSSWKPDDAAAKIVGGEIDIIKRYEDSKAAVGVKFRFKSVQSNYINDPNAEVNNQIDVWKKIDANVKVSDATVFGTTGKQFDYKQSTGKRTGEIRSYWVRVIPELKLELWAFVYEDSKDREDFWNEVDDIVQSIVIDTEKFKKLRKNLKNS